MLTDVGGRSRRGALDARHDRQDGALRRDAALEHLPEGRATVGFEVHVKHVAAALEGPEYTARVALCEIVDARKLRFDIEVREGERVIGVGTHERRAVQRA